MEPHWRLFYDGVPGMTLVARIGNSIYVFRLERWREPRSATVGGDAAIQKACARSHWPQRLTNLRGCPRSGPGLHRPEHLLAIDERPLDVELSAEDDHVGERAL